MILAFSMVPKKTTFFKISIKHVRREAPEIHKLQKIRVKFKTVPIPVLVDYQVVQ